MDSERSEGLPQGTIVPPRHDGQEPMGSDEGRPAGAGTPEGDGVPGDAVDGDALARLKWTISFQGQTWTQNDINVGTLITIGELIDGPSDWRILNPANSPKILATYLIVLLAQATETPVDVVMPFVFALSTDALLDCLTLGG